jgi:hypothetical protein
MDDPIKYALCFAAGFFIARYVIVKKGSDKYLKEEGKALDKIRNSVHDWIAQNTNLGDAEIGDEVLKITKV